MSQSGTASPSLSAPLSPAPEDCRGPGRTGWWYARCALALLLTAVALAWHARETLTRFPPGFREKDPLPFLQNDHPLHYYYSQVTADFFARRRSFWGYDPNFMAGYAKTMIFPTGCSLPELVAIVCGKNSVRAFRLFVASCVFLPPIFLALAARTLARRWSAAMLALLLGVAWVWISWPTIYVIWGMAPFVMGITASLWGATLLADWLDTRSRCSLAAGVLVATLATIAHPCAPVILTVMMFPAYFSCVRTLSWREHAVAWIVPLFVFACWTPWWLPALRLKDTFGTTASGFVNENILGRLQELARAEFPEETALLVAGAAAVGPLWGIGRAKFCAVAVGLAGFFVITYFGSAVVALWSIQPGRYTQPLYALLAVTIGVGWVRLGERLKFQTWNIGTWIMLVVSCVTSCLALMLATPKVFAFLHSTRTPFLTARLPGSVRDLITSLRDHTDSSGRILFEDRGELELGPIDPYPGTNPSALLPLLVPGQYIGGPYLKTHLKTNFTQFGDGKFFGHDLTKQSIDLATFQQYAELYNIRWAVLRFSPVSERELIARGAPEDLAGQLSTPLVGLADANPDVFRLLGQFGLIRVYELKREPNWAIVGQANVVAAPDRLDVTGAQPAADGRLVLSYHWISTLHSTVPLRPVWLADDPAPFISVENAPEQFVIENLLW